MPNIILDNNRFRTVDFNVITEYELTDLNFYIPADFFNYAVYAIIYDSSGVNEICSLVNTELRSNRKVFKFDPSYSYRIKSGNSTIYLVLISPDMKTAVISQDFHANIKIDKMKVSHYTLLTETFSQQLADTYTKIEELTKLNIDIYEKILSLHKEVT